MPRNRMIKPEFWSSPQVVWCCHSARLLFVGMLNFADDRGCMPASVDRLKMEIFPGDDWVPREDVQAWLRELVSVGLVSEYACGDDRYLHICKFTKHQRIQRPTYTYPPPPQTTGDSASPPGALQEPSRSPPPKAKEAKRSEGSEGKEGSEEKEEKEKKLRSIDRSIDSSSDVKIDWAVVIGNAKTLCGLIREKPAWNDFDGAGAFAEVLLYAAAAVESGVLPLTWLDGGLAKMLEGRRKTKPAGYLGKVLAADALEIYGVDWDDWKRGITLPKRKEPDK